MQNVKVVPFIVPWDYFAGGSGLAAMSHIIELHIARLSAIPVAGDLHGNLSEQEAPLRRVAIAQAMTLGGEQAIAAFRGDAEQFGSDFFPAGPFAIRP